MRSLILLGLTIVGISSAAQDNGNRYKCINQSITLSIEMASPSASERFWHKVSLVKATSSDVTLASDRHFMIQNGFPMVDDQAKSYEGAALQGTVYYEVDSSGVAINSGPKILVVTKGFKVRQMHISRTEPFSPNEKDRRLDLILTCVPN